MITTPEQMREAAAKCCDQFDGPACNSAFVMGQATAAQQIRAAIRAIPSAPQPVAVTVKPLVWQSARVSDRYERFSANSPWGKYEAIEWSDGTFGGTLPPADCDIGGVEFSVESMSAALSYCQVDYVERMKPLFADPLSDPRVVALVDVVQRLLKKHDPCENWHVTRAALRAIGGEA